MNIGRVKGRVLGAFLLAAIILGGYTIQSSSESLNAKEPAKETKKTDNKIVSTNASTKSEEKKHDIPVIDPNEAGIALSSNPDFTEWTPQGTPEGWTVPVTVETYNPSPYDPENYNTVMFGASKSDSRGAIYYTWQRVEGGGLNAVTSFQNQTIANTGFTISLSKKIQYEESMGQIVTIVVNAQKSNIPTSFFPTGTYFKGGYNAASIGLYYGDDASNRGSLVVLGNEQGDVYADKVMQLKLTPKMLQDMKYFKNIYRLNAINSYNSIQWNHLAFYATNMIVETEGAFEVPVGAEFEEYYQTADFKNTITNATYYTANESGEVHEEEIAPDSLTFEGILGEYPDTSRVSDQNVNVLFSADSADGTPLKGIASIPLKVVWGNTVSLGGNTNNLSMSTLAFSLLKRPQDGAYEIRSNLGDGTMEQSQINPSVEKTYYQVDYYPVSELHNLTQDLDDLGSATLAAKGTDRPVDLLETWGAGGKTTVEIGSVLRVYMEDPAKEWLYKDNELSSFTPSKQLNGKWLFYKITEDGFEPLYLNQIEGKKNISVDFKTPSEVVTELFNQKPWDYMTGTADQDYSAVEFNGEFTNGPDTSVASKKDVPSTLQVTAKTDDMTIKFDINPTFAIGSTATEFQPWLPYYKKKWLDSSTESIPASHAFVMMYTEKTEPVFGEGRTSKTIENNLKNNVYGMPTYNSPNKNTVAYPTDDGEQYITFSNVGYYNGKSVYVKVNIKPEKKSAREEYGYSYIGFQGEDFLTVSLDKNSVSADVRFEFQDADGNPMKISGYWTLDNLNDVKNVVLPESEIENIYSVSRTYSSPIQVQYELVENPFGTPGKAIQLKGNTTPGTRKATVTYTNQTEFDFQMVFNKNSNYGFSILYFPGTDAKVEIPTPQGIDQVFDKITEENYGTGQALPEEPLNYQFVQQIPYETPANQKQEMVWQLPTDTEEPVTSTLTEADWYVVNEEGTVVYGEGKTVSGTFFTYDDTANTLKANKSNANLYNHYYTFQRNMTINTEEPIDPDLLEPKDGKGKYLDYTGDVELQVTDGTVPLEPVSTKFSTFINFEAEATYQPVYRDESGSLVNIPDSESETDDTLLITHPFKEITPPYVENYTYSDESVPENYTEEIVRYSKEDVQLIYSEGNGVLDFVIPDEMNFGSVNVPLYFKKTQYLQNVDPEWGIRATDTRSERTPWKLTAKLTEENLRAVDREYKGIKDAEYEENIPLMASILRFTNKQGKINDLRDSVEIYDTGDQPQSMDGELIQWTEKNTGFNLDLKAFGYYPEGKYKATIEFTLELTE